MKKDCWNWTGSLTDKGYGRIYIGGKHRRAHRVVYMNLVGAIPPGMNVLHDCDNPRCVNPEHLFLGTQVDNMQDCSRKGRQDWQKRPLKESTLRRKARADVPPWEKTHCIHGHALSGINLYVRKDGRRKCRQCNLLLERKRKARLRLERLQDVRRTTSPARRARNIRRF